MKITPTITLLLAAAVVLTTTPVPPLQAQGQSAAQGQPEVSAAVRYDTSRPLREMTPKPVTNTRESFEVKMPPLPERAPVTDQAVQRFITSALAATPGISFDGVGEGNPEFPGFNVNVAPPDTTGDASPTQYVQWVNLSFAVFDKATGNSLFGPAAGNTLFTGFGGNCETNNHGDPIVQYDQLADRWVMTQFSLTTGNFLQCVAVSQTGDATGAYHRYAFSYSEFPDYPKLAVWPDAYYITFNMFGATGSSFTGGRVCAYDRTKMLAGLAATQICFQNLAYPSPLPSDLDGQTLPPGGSPNYVLTLSTINNTSLHLWKFHTDFVTPANATFTGPTAIPVTAFTGALPVPQSGTTQKLDSLADRLMYRLAYRNLGTREALTVNHAVRVATIAGVRWYELDITGGVPTVRQQATYSPDTSHRWMGSMAMDNVGNIAIGYSRSSSALKPSVLFAGREATDPLNTMSVESTMHTGTGSQTGLSRWGDYSTLSIDPADDCTFWYTSEYLQANGSFNWSTRIGSFKFASCDGAVGDFTISATPPRKRIIKPNSTTFAVTVTPSGGFSETVTFSTTGCPANTTCTFAPPTVNGGGPSTLTIQTTASTPSGNFVIGVVGTSPSLMRSTSVIVVIQ